MLILPGSPFPLGATWDGGGVNFALYSENATAVELCLFDEAGVETRARLPHSTQRVWHGYLPDVGPGQRYAYRVHGPYEPERGLRFNPEVTLLDPYARALDGVERWELGCFAYALGAPEGDLEKAEAPQLGAPRGVVIDPDFDWEGDEPPRTPLHRSVIYEAHVKGLTMRHPDIPEPLRGTYSGIAHPVTLRYLRDLGVTAIELMPVHAFADDKLLLDRGLRNYWGYSTLSFFAPDVRYKTAGPPGSEVHEFKEMVKALHRAGIEVILDVVYNHTAEGNHLGPTFHMKGIDNPTYYRLVAGEPRYYFDYTGTGNTLNVRHPQVLALIMDSLRYWAIDMHVDGFRFDLASALARQLHEVDQLGSFFALIHQSPTLGQMKLIAEPWDLGEGGYQVGNFPVRWAEWNGRYRDAVRALWRGDGGKAGEIGYRLTGSSDLYQGSGRRPAASVNFVTAHDGFTLRDLVSYSRRHNEANGEDNRDGAGDDRSWNCGVEGPTTDEAVNALRRRQQKNLLATLLLSQGTPMITAGDEQGRTQGGNNNAYCQDNETSWLDWAWSDEQRSLFDFTRRLLRIRREHPALHRSKFFQGRSIHGTDLRDLLWFRHDGQPMSEDDWNNPVTQSFAMFLAGRGIDDVDAEGRPLVDDNLLLVLNASSGYLQFAIPELTSVREPWQLLVDTADDQAEELRAPGERTGLVAHSLKLYRSPSRVIRTGGALHTLGSTYRLQLQPGFGFRQAAEIVDYLADLGITDVYCSPIFAAARGSTHGYDVVDHGRLSPALGPEEDFFAWTSALRERGMGLLLDWVPNHMGIAPGQNILWDDVLENGQSSLYAEVFDIEWAPPREDLRGRILLPILGDQYGEVLERAELRIVREEGVFRLAYFDHRLPLGPRTLGPLLTLAITRSGLSPDAPARQEMESILTALSHLPERRETAPGSRAERAREKEVVKRRLAAVVDSSPEMAAGIEGALGEFNGTPGVAASYGRLDRLLGEQGYRLASWRVASEEINYRRFFDVNDLAAIRMELPQVFERAHARLFELISQGHVQALRLDHTDGLHDPRGYFEALQRRSHPGPAALPGASPDDLARPLPILIEKILEPGEDLPPSWPVDGTTGYDFGAAVMGLFVDPAAEPALTRAYKAFTGDARTFEQHVHESKEYILKWSLASELQMLGRALLRIAAKNRSWRDFTLGSLTVALREIIASFPVYRTYLREGEPPGEHDEGTVHLAVEAARARNPHLDPSLFAFLLDLLLLRAGPGEDDRKEQTTFALRFQQLTGPVTAKSVEDTAFYRYSRLVSANEVGAHPSHLSVSIDDLHAKNEARARAWPLSMLTTSTHDSKRGEDAAARITVLSEMPETFARAVKRWSEIARRMRPPRTAVPPPAPSLEYLFYQTAVGVLPPGWDGEAGRQELTSRLESYLLKACREAKTETSWTRPSPEYEAGVTDFVRRMMGNDTFLRDMRAFCRRLDPHGATNSLALCVLRLCSPGVPDTYQGAELWSQSLVDPDNRRPVDFEERRRALASIEERTDRRALARDLLESFQDGRVKMFVLRSLLQLRRRHRDLFLRGDYEALRGGGDHLFAFARHLGRERLICLAPRLPHGKTGGKPTFPVGDVWGTETLAVPFSGVYRDVFTEEAIVVKRRVSLSEALRDLPVAVLLSDTPSEERVT